MSDRSEAIAWAEKVSKSKPPRYTHASRNAAAFILETEAAWNQRAKPCIDVDRLANIIRTVDGSNTMGAGDLAEAIVNHLEGYDD